MNQSSPDCLCVGIIVADHVCEPVEHVPVPGELVLTRRMDLTIGGCASNVAVDLVKLGVTASVAGKIGNDVFGRYVREALEAAGVGCEQIVESSTQDTSGTFVINSQGEDRRFIHCIGANGEFTGKEVSADQIRRSRVLYLGGYLLIEALAAKNVAALFEVAREAGVVTVLDVVIPREADYWPMLEPALPLTDVFLPNDDESRLITGLEDPLAQAERFRQAGVGTVVVTCGNGGAVLIGEGERLQAGRYPVEFVDGTGSGDAFAAGYIYGLINGHDSRGCLRYGSALGASCVRSTGATTGVFDASELKTFVAANELTITPA
jgi:sugar/nucleoside kinase (ribokinase family)